MKHPVPEAGGPCDVAIIGAGFGGTLLARALHARGLSVVLLERDAHPRFALGESSTPLGNLCLERLAHRYGLVDLWHLAQHGRWLEHAPRVRRGLKRGFTFYRHFPGRPLAAEARNPARLLVAASPDDRVADTHWMRSDVDAFWVEHAIAEGVDYRPGTMVVGADVGGVRDSAAESTAGNVRLELETAGAEGPVRRSLTARFVVDASGPGGALTRALGIATGADGLQTHSGLVATHFDGLPEFEVGRATAGRPPGPVPYPADRAAVHHWIDEGWVYALRFDDGRVSAGLLLEGPEHARVLQDGRDPAEVWASVTGRYPDLADWLSHGTPAEPWQASPRLQRRSQRATGARWAMLPHAYGFVDPMFSTGIAWTLLGVERLAGMVLEAAAAGDAAPGRAELDRYEAQMAREFDQIDALVAGAYRARTDFRLTAAHSMLYFAAVSHAESLQRLRPTEHDAWSGFLGIDDPFLATLPAEALDVLRILHRGGGLEPSGVPRFERWVEAAIEDRNVAGLADPAKDNLYGVELADLHRHPERLGMTAAEVMANIGRVRGTPRPDPVRHERARS